MSHMHKDHPPGWQQMNYTHTAYQGSCLVSFSSVRLVLILIPVLIVLL